MLYIVCTFSPSSLCLLAFTPIVLAAWVLPLLETKLRAGFGAFETYTDRNQLTLHLRCIAGLRNATEHILSITCILVLASFCCIKDLGRSSSTCTLHALRRSSESKTLSCNSTASLKQLACVPLSRRILYLVAREMIVFPGTCS